MSLKTVKDMVPGDPEKVWQVADSYNHMAHICEEVGHGFRLVDDGGWSGRAADAFRARFEQQPNRFHDAADNYGQVAVALDTFAAVLAWAQRRAGEVIALDDEETPHANPSQPTQPPLTATQQAELTGVISGAGGSEPAQIRDDPRVLALSNYHRALAMLDTVGDESAAAIREATEAMPGPFPAQPLDTPAPTPTQLSTATAATDHQDMQGTLPTPVPAKRTWFEPSMLRDDPRDWDAAIKDIRKRLRWDGLDRLSPSLSQHLFEGHYKPKTGRYSGYHHRHGGVDHGRLHIVQVIEGPDQNGVYAAYYRGPRSRHKKKSTFFPDTWSPAEVLYAVRRAFLDAMQKMSANYRPEDRRFLGVYRGIRIMGYLKGRGEPKLCDIRTAFPYEVQNKRERHE